MTYKSGILAVYTALIMMICFACENTERNPQTEGPAKNTLRDSVETEEVAVTVMAGADTTLQSNSLMNTMAPKWSVEEVLQKYPEAEITNREPVPNRHTDGQIDTLITIKSDSTIFQFYSLSDRDLLQTATLSKEGIALGNGLEVGMTAEEVTQHIEPLKGRKSVPQSILIRAEQAPTSIRLRFRQNRLSSIDYQGYVD